MIEFVKYTFNPNASDGSTVDLLPIMPEEFNYSISDVQVEGNIQRTLSCEDSEISKLTSMRFGDHINDDKDGIDVSNRALSLLSVELLNVSTLTSCNQMFRKCGNVSKIDTTNFSVNNVTNMSGMFLNCHQLTQLDVSNFDTSKVENMNSMFHTCPQLTQLDVSKWDTGKVENMGYMFLNCHQLTQLDVSNWDTSSVKNMDSMFQYCSQLTIIGDVSKWDTSNVTNMANMFYFCSQLTQLDVSNWNTSNVQYMDSMFQSCSKLTQLDVSNWDTSKVVLIYSMFHTCSQLTQLDVSKWNTSKVTLMSSMFHNCSKLTQLDVSNWDTSNVTNMYGMFTYCSKLTQLDVSNWNTSNVTNMGSMFYSCSQLAQLDVSNWDTSNVTVMNGMFYICSKLTQLDVSNWNTSNVTNMNNMFNNCPQLTQLDVSKWDTGSVTDMNSMFKSCSKLTQLEVSNWDTGNVQYMQHMFHTCSKLTQLDVSNWDTSNVTTMDYMFYNCSQLTQLDVSNWNTSKVTDMNYMFHTCSQLTQLDVSNWDTSNVTSNVTTIFKPYSALLNWSIEEINRFVDNNTDSKSTVYVNCDISKLNKNDLITYKYYNGNKIDIKCNEENPLLVQGNSIEKIEDDYKLYKNKDKLILDGSEEWVIYNTHDTTITFSMQVQDKIQENTPLLCNNIPYYGRYKGYHGYELDEENIYYYRNNLYVTISKLIIRNVEDFKAWLSSNPLEVIYTMQVQEEIPCTSLTIDNYNNSTIIQLDTNDIHSDIETRLLAARTIIPYSLKKINDIYDRIYWDVNTRSYKFDKAIEEVALTQQLLSNNISKNVYETSNHYVMQFNKAIIGNTTKPFISNKFSVQEFSASVGKYNTIMYTDTDIYVYILKDEIKESINNNSFINKLIEWETNLIYILNTNKIINIPNTRLPRLYQHDNTDIVIATDLINPSKVIFRYKDIN